MIMPSSAGGPGPMDNVGVSGAVRSTVARLVGPTRRPGVRRAGSRPRR